MKKFAMAAVAAAALSAGVAQAYTVGTYSNGFVVPNVIHNGPTDTTAVGLINQTGQSVAVYWTFFDQNSTHITDGCFAMTNKDYEPFIWSQQSGGGLSGTRGYLVFAAGATTAGGAAKDVAFVPVIDGPLTIAAGHDVTKLNNVSLTAVAGAAQVGAAGAAPQPTFSMRYAIDQAAGGTDTSVVVWSTGNHSGTHTVNIYDDKQNRKSVNFKLVKAELDWFDPETIAGLPATFNDGFIEWTAGTAVTDSTATLGTPLATLGGSVFTYSAISSAAFGAVQTVLGSHK